MSAGFAVQPGGAPQAARTPAALAPDAHAGERAEATGLRLACFFALASFCGLQYATLLLHPPALRVLGVALVATAAGAAVAAGARLPVAPGVRLAAAAALVVVALALALVTVGIPLALLAPGRWHTLGHQLDRGFEGLAGWLWPYRGDASWPRLTVLALLAPVQVGAAVACFWPDRRGRGWGRVLALALLLALLVAGLANQTEPAWQVQGAILLALLAAWLWLPRLQPAAATRAARWLCAAALAGLAVAAALDARGPLIDFRNWDPVPVTASFRWDQTYGPIPWSRSDATMLEVAEPHPTLLRVSTLDRFDGLRFLRSDAPPGSVAQDVPLLHRGGGGFLSATVAVAGLRSPLIVSGGGEPLRVRWLSPGAPTSAPAPDGTMALRPAPKTGDRYEVLSYAPTPGAVALREAPASYPAAYLPYARFELPATRASNLAAANLGAEAAAADPAGRVVGAPAPGRTPASDPRIARRIAASPYGPAFALARRLARGARSPYDVAQRIQRYLLGHYTYDEHPRRSRYPLEAFLFDDRRGYCQQFSGAMTLLLRMDGIPARVAAGFRPGSFDAATGHARVTALDAHAWVEVFFSGVGWVPFDPTPPRAAAQPLPGGVAAPERQVPRGRAAGAPGRRGHPARPAAGRPHARPGSATPWALLAAAAFAGAICLVAGAWWLAGAARLRRGMRGDGAGAIAELGAALRRLGFGGGGDAVTIAQLERALAGRRGGRASAHLAALRARRYGRAGEGARPTAQGRRELRRALVQGAGLRTRLWALLALPPGAARRS